LNRRFKWRHHQYIGLPEKQACTLILESASGVKTGSGNTRYLSNAAGDTGVYSNWI